MKCFIFTSVLCLSAGEKNHGVRSEKKHFFMKNAKDYDFLFSNVLTF